MDPHEEDTRFSDKGPRRSVEHETVVKKIDLKSFKEKQALETLRLMMHQAMDSVNRNVETTDVSRYNRFDACSFLADLKEIQDHVLREFPCTKE